MFFLVTSKLIVRQKPTGFLKACDAEAIQCPASRAARVEDGAELEQSFPICCPHAPCVRGGKHFTMLPSRKAASPSPPALPDAPAQRLQCGHSGGASRGWSVGVSAFVAVAVSPLCEQCDSSAVAVGPAVTMLGTRGRPELAVGGEAG